MCDICGPDRSSQVVDHSITHPFKLESGTDNRCASCGEHLSVHPDKMEYLRQKEMDSILDHGHQVRMIFDPDEDTLPFAYTMGRALHGKPELYMIGPIDPRQQATVLNEVAAQVESLYDGQVLEAGAVEGVDCALRIFTVPDLEAVEMNGVVNKFPGASAFQVVFPDPAGLFPGEAGFDERYDQPIASRS